MTCNCDATQDSAAAGSGANCHIPALWQSLTVSEAAALFGYHRNTIHFHIDAGRLAYRETSAGGYLIELDSLIQCFGQPPKHNWTKFVRGILTFEPLF